MIAEALTIEGDEDGFHLIVEADGERFDFHIHHLAYRFADDVDKVIGGWRREGQTVEREVAHVRDDEEDCPGYDLDDPKHPTYHERMTDL